MMVPPARGLDVGATGHLWGPAPGVASLGRQAEKPYPVTRFAMSALRAISFGDERLDEIGQSILMQWRLPALSDLSQAPSTAT